jgi:hypothetical protein
VALQLGPKGRIPADEPVVLLRDTMADALEHVIALGTVFDTASVVPQADVDMLARLVRPRLPAPPASPLQASTD